MKFLQSEKNEIFDIIVDLGISPSHFYFENCKSEYTKEQTESIRVKNNDYFFIIDSTNANYYILQFKPGAMNTKTMDTSSGWPGIRELIIKWLNRIKLDLTEPNKWQEYQNFIDNSNAKFQNEDNTLFSFSEVQLISASVSNLKVEINKLKLKAPDANKLNAKLDYLVEKAKVMGRVDWKGLFIGSLINVIIQSALPSATASSIWHLIGDALRRVFILALNP